MEANAENTLAKKGFDYCESLFCLAKEYEQLTEEKRYKARQKYSVPILNEFKVWADIQRVPVKSAMTYLDNQWKYLSNYTLDTRLEISNNLAECSIKPFVIDRKNFLFSNTPNGAQSTAVTMSIIETAKANSIDPYQYLM